VRARRISFSPLLLQRLRFQISAFRFPLSTPRFPRFNFQLSAFQFSGFSANQAMDDTGIIIRNLAPFDSQVDWQVANRDWL